MSIKFNNLACVIRNYLGRYMCFSSVNKLFSVFDRQVIVMAKKKFIIKMSTCNIKVLENL